LYDSTVIMLCQLLVALGNRFLRVDMSNGPFLAGQTLKSFKELIVRYCVGVDVNVFVCCGREGGA